MTYKFMLLHRSEINDDWSVVEAHANTHGEFLKAVDKHIIRDNEWVVYRVDEGTHKDQYLHSGELDNIIPE